MRCLLVDDNEEFLSSATRLLGSHGVEIVGCASSIDEALRLTSTLRPEVVLVDVELGDEDGFDLARRIRSQIPATHVILISSYEPDDLEELITASPALGFIPKRELGGAAIAALLA